VVCIIFKKENKVEKLGREFKEMKRKLDLEIEKEESIKREVKQKDELTKMYKEQFKEKIKEEKKKVKQEIVHDSKIEKKDFFKSLKAKFYKKTDPTSIILVEMTHNNGTITHFIVKVKSMQFTYKKCAYIIDEERKQYCTSTQSYMYRFNEGFAVPYSVELTSAEMHKNLTAEVQEVSTSFNPSVLKEVLKFEYAKGVIQGAEVHDFLRKAFLVNIIILITVIIHFLLHAYMSKWINI